MRYAISLYLIPIFALFQALQIKMYKIGWEIKIYYNKQKKTSSNRATYKMSQRITKKIKRDVTQGDVTSTGQNNVREEKRLEMRNKYRLNGMDVFTQAMLSNKKAFIASQANGDVSEKIPANYTPNSKSETRLNNKSLKAMRVHSQIEAKEIEKKHKNRKIERERTCQKMRAKYKLNKDNSFHKEDFSTNKRERLELGSSIVGEKMNECERNSQPCKGDFKVWVVKEKTKCVIQ